MPRWILYVFAVVVIVVGSTAAYFEIQCGRHDLETRDLNDEARREASGSFVRLPGGVTHYQFAGPPDGRIVVLIHGFSVPGFLWDKTFEPLASAGFRVLRYDAFGRGYSDRPDMKYDETTFLNQLSDLLDALHVNGPVDVIGASLGGPLAAGFAVRHPERVRSVTLFDPGYLDGEPLPWRLRTPLVGEYVMCTRIAPRLTESQKEDFMHPERYPAYFEQYAAQLKFKGTRGALLSTLREFVSRDDRPDYTALGRSGKPVLLFWGKNDKDVPFEVSKQVMANVPQAEFHPLDDAAHVAFYEMPETVNPVVVEFLRKH